MAFETSVVYDPLSLNFTETLSGDGQTEPTNWKRGEFIGGGGFGHVYSMTVNEKDTTVSLAVKQIHVSPFNKDQNTEALKKEIDILSRLNHERIIPYYGYCQKDNMFFLFMERMAMGSLQSFLKEMQNPDLSQSEIVHITKQILEGLNYLHLEKIIHRDIKAANVLLQNKFNIKLADFGLSKQLEQASTATSYVGTKRWMAPEIFHSERHYGNKVDIWALGCTVLEMITRDRPFKDDGELDVIKKLIGKNPSPVCGLDVRCSEYLKEFLDNIFKENPRERPSAKELLSTLILSNGNESSDNISTAYEVKTNSSNLHSLHHGCRKNPGHPQFIPINDFNILHLPKEYQDNEIVDFIKTVADLTVIVAVRMMSTARPRFMHTTNIPYPFPGFRGNKISMRGSGIVYKVDILKNNRCQCYKCQCSDTPSNLWGEIWVVTATHVIFDDIEAKQTTCTLFYNSQDDTPVQFGEFTVVENDVLSDRCMIKASTCDIGLLNKLQVMVYESEVIKSKLYKSYWNSSDEYKLCIITSHPHSCEKQVSVGHWIEKIVSGAENTKYTYTTCTCPGSAGAPVVIFSRLDHKGYHTHSLSDFDGYNFSGTYIG